MQIAPVPAVSSGSTSEDVAVLFLDMVSYARRVSENEVATLEFMSDCFDTLRVLARRYNGVLVKTMGDGAVLHFAEPGNAIDFGIGLHRVIDRMQLRVADPFLFRVGVHLGQVTFRDGDIFGKTVNIASRLENHALPGECVVSSEVRSSVRQTSAFRFESIGTPRLKNISQPVAAYRVIDPERHEQPRPDALPALRLIGPPGIPGALGGDMPGLPARGLLAYLALTAGNSERLDRLEMMFGGPELLHQAVREICAVGPFEVQADADSGLATLSGAVNTTDIGQVLDDLRQNRLSRSVIVDPHWPAAILAGLDGISPVFDAWVEVTRDRWKWLLLREMERMIERTEPEDHQREAAAEALLAQEPGNEAASLARIECRLAHADQSGALEEFRRLETFLRDHYAISPGDRVRGILQGLLARRPMRRTTPDGVDNRGRLLRIDVMPFNGTGAMPITGTFREELIGNLSRFRDWSVRDSASRPEAPERPIRPTI